MPIPGWPTSLGNPGLIESLFDQLPDVAFFVKDRRARYLLVNESLLERCGIKHKNDLLGRTAEEVFPPALGATYTAQDRHVLETGAEIRDRLELHLYPGASPGWAGGRSASGAPIRSPGWCLTFKTPLRDERGSITGLVGISRDLHRPDERRAEYRRLAAAVEHVREHYDGPVRLEELAGTVGLSMDRFERLVKRVFHLTPRQLLTKTRIDAASRLLRGGRASISEIAQACGYSDHSAFTRQFRATVGLSPRAFREVELT